VIDSYRNSQIVSDCLLEEVSKRKCLLAIGSVILSGASCSFIARGAVEGPAVGSVCQYFLLIFHHIQDSSASCYKSTPPG